MKTLQDNFDPLLLPADRSLLRKHIQRELDEIREEVEETCKVVSDVRPVLQQAYDEASTLLKRISPGIPMPDLMWLEDGGIGLEWRPKEGIATMSLYGDNQVTFGTVWRESSEIWGSCPLSDPVLFPNFLKMLSEVFQK